MKAISRDITALDAEIFALKVRLAKTHDSKQAMMLVLLTGRTRLV